MDDTLSDGFGPGFNGPLMLVVDGKSSDDPKAAATKVTDTVKDMKDVVSVSPAAFAQGRGHRDDHGHPRLQAVLRQDRGPGARHP